MDKQKETFGIRMQKKNPKKNPITYELKTISEIFNMLNSKNINRFMKEFKLGMQASVAMRDAINAVAKDLGDDVPENAIEMTSFTWIDD